MKPALLSLLLATTLLTGPAFAQNHDHAPAAQAQIGEITITGAFARATLPRAPVGGAYLTITNAGAEDDRLIGATAMIGRNVELHEMAMENGVMSMRLLADGLVIPAGGSVTLDPSGMHLMINGLTERLEQGGTLPLVLCFERAGELTVAFDILALNARDHPDWPEAETAHDAEEHDHSAHGHDRAGRALLRCDGDGLWRDSNCAGSDLKGEANMIQMGVAPDIAARLAATQAEAESALTPDHAAQLDLFNQGLLFDAEAGETGIHQY